MTWPWWARVLHPAPASPSPSVQTERNTTPYVPAQARRVARWSGRPKPRRNMPRAARPTIQPSPDERFNMAVPPIASTRRAAPAAEGIPPPQIPPPARAGTRHDALPLSVRVLFHFHQSWARGACSPASVRRRLRGGPFPWTPPARRVFPRAARPAYLPSAVVRYRDGTSHLTTSTCVSSARHGTGRDSWADRSADGPKTDKDSDCLCLSYATHAGRQMQN